MTRTALWLMAIYHLLAGAVFFLIPTAPLRASGLPPEIYAWSLHVLLFRLAGLLSLTVGLGAWLAARGRERNTDLLRVLLLAKAGGAVVLGYYGARGEFGLLLFLVALVHDAIWLLCLGAILWPLRKAGPA